MKTVFYVLLAILGSSSLFADGGEKRLLGKSGEESYTGKVVLIEVGEDDLVNDQSFRFWERTIERVQEEKAKALIFKLDTPGGLAFATHDLMGEIAKLEIPTISFIDPMAMSAGAMIAVSTERIYMAPGSTVGSAAVVNGSGAEIEEHMRAKIESFFDAHVRWVAEKQGHRPEVVRAMMVLDEEERQIGPILVKKGELLALNSSEAVKMLDDGPLFAVGEVESLDEVLKQEGLDGADLVTATPTGFEKFAWWVASISGLLLLIGLAAGYFEIQTPGFGAGGIVAGIAFATFFFGNYLAGNMAGYETAAIFALGIGLIALEVFIIPGFGVPGILGLLLVVGSLLTAMTGEFTWDRFEFEGIGFNEGLGLLERPAIHLSIGIFGGSAVVMLMMRYLPELGFMKKLMVPATAGPGTGIEDVPEAGQRVGQTGIAGTDLRPAGKAIINGEELDVVAEGEFVSKDDAVRIVKEDGMGIVVKKV
ncbi:MAG: NfeD family protein [Akkermansiaceae bacterium]